MITLAQIHRQIESARQSMPKPPAERGLNSEERIREVRKLLACMAELDAAGLRWPRETPLTPGEQAVYEVILTAHGIPIRKEPLNAEDIAFIERVERQQADRRASRVQP
jgi:hypothetical protein